jgi:hypothetical protein
MSTPNLNLSLITLFLSKLKANSFVCPFSFPYSCLLFLSLSSGGEYRIRTDDPLLAKQVL